MFSVIMPYYKNSKYVVSSIKSVLAQEYQEFELIVVDDGSNDNLKELLSQIDDTRIRLLTQDNQGVSAARNNGIAQAKYEWICFLDSDDLWKTNHLSVIREMQEQHPDAAFYMTSHLRKGNKKEFYSNSTFPDGVDCWVIKDFLRVSLNKPAFIHTNSVCIKKELLLSLGGFAAGVQRGEDTDLWCRCSLYTDVIAHREVTTIYQQNNSYLTKEKKFNYDWIFLKREKELLKDLTIPEGKRYSLRLYNQKYKLSICKHLLAENRKKEAVILHHNMKDELCSELKKENLVISLMMILPGFLSAVCLRTYYLYK